MKKVIALLLALSMCFTLCGCATKNDVKGVWQTEILDSNGNPICWCIDTHSVEKYQYEYGLYTEYNRDNDDYYVEEGWHWKSVDDASYSISFGRLVIQWKEDGVISEETYKVKGGCLYTLEDELVATKISDKAISAYMPDIYGN